MSANLEPARAAVAERLARPDVGIVLGSGLGEVVSIVEGRRSLEAAAIPGMPRPTTAGHAGRLHAGRVGTATVLVSEGRVHLYEGRSIDEVVFAVRLLVAAGASRVLLTGAAGGLRADLGAGRLLLVRDHVNLTGLDPARGAATGQVGFPDRTRLYAPGLASELGAAAERSRVALTHGVLAGVIGPSYETPAEAEWLRRGGADAVAMSTVLEAMAASDAGAEVAALAIVTNDAAGSTGLDHDAVLVAAGDAAAAVATLVRAWLA